MTNAGTGQRTLHSLQVYRGLAALFVVLQHATLILYEQFSYESFDGFFSWGFSGVSVFFVLSGFIICLIHYNDIGKPQRAGNYLYKRFVRIYPVYWVVLLFFIPGYFLRDIPIDSTYLFDNVTLLPVSGHGKLNSVAWTLSYEIVFYIVFLLVIINRVLGVVAIGAIFFLIAYGFVTGGILMPPYMLATFSGLEYGTVTNLVRHMSNPLNLLFLMGAAAFFVIKLVRRWVIAETVHLTALLIGVMGYAGVCIYWLHEGRAYIDVGPFHAFFGVCAFFLMVGGASRFSERWASKRKTLLLLGDASYSIYLVHFGVQFVMLDLLGGDFSVDLRVVFVALLVFPLLIGLFFHKYVELPMLGFFRRRPTVT